jgi:hypothetical protein
MQVTRGIIQEGDEWDFDRDEDLFDLEAAMGADLADEMPEVPEEEAETKKKRLKEELSFQEMVEKYLDVSHKKSKRQKVRIKGKLVAVVDNQEDEREDEQAIKLKRVKVLGDGKSADWFSQELFAGVDADIQDVPERVIEFGDDEIPADASLAQEMDLEDEQDDQGKQDDEGEELNNEGENDVRFAGNDRASEKAVRANRLGLLKMGRSLISGETNLKEMVDDSFNRWTGAANEQNAELPEWFVEKESEYWKAFEQDEEHDERDVARVKVCIFLHPCFFVLIQGGEKRELLIGPSRKWLKPRRDASERLKAS